MNIKNLIAIGYFREMGGSQEQQGSRPSLADHVSLVPQPDEDRIVLYLETAPQIAVRGGPLERDALDPLNGVRIQDGMKSDGVYVWSTTLAYYVATYHIKLSESFMAHLASQNWEPPKSVELLHD